MLSQTDKEKIAKKAYIYDHEWSYHSLIFGEPFLISGFLCFFDGETLFINGYGLEKPLEFRDISKIKESNPAFEKAKFVDTWGPNPLEGKIEGFETKTLCTPDPLNCDHFIDLDEFELEKFPHAAYSLKKARAKGIQVELAEEKLLTSSHIDLMREFLAAKNVFLSQTSFILAIQPFLFLNHARLYNAYHEKKLVGFNIVSTLFLHRPIGLQRFVQHGIPGVSDALQFAIIEDSKKQKARFLDLGYSMGIRGLHEFKLKWGATHQEPPYYEQFFCQKGQTIPDFGKEYLCYNERLAQQRLQKTP